MNEVSLHNRPCIEAIRIIGLCKRDGVEIRSTPEGLEWTGTPKSFDKQKLYDKSNDLKDLLKIKWSDSVRLDLAFEVFKAAHVIYAGKLVQILEMQDQEWVGRYQKLFAQFWGADNLLTFCYWAEAYLTHVHKGKTLWIAETDEGAAYAAKQAKLQEIPRKATRLTRKKKKV